MIISIDGPAGSGKSTVAEILAKKLGFAHFNSGSLYRAVTAYVIKNNLDVDVSFEEIAKLPLKVEFINGEQHVFVDGTDFTNHLRDNIVSQKSSYVSKFKPIRNMVDNCQHHFATNNNVVIEGRDIGSFVFPNAEHKFYLDCSVDVRAERRFKEEQAKGSNVSLEEIKLQIIARDKFDKEKPTAPLVVPKNAVVIDSTNLTAEQVAEIMFKKIKQTV